MDGITAEMLLKYGGETVVELMFMRYDCMKTERNTRCMEESNYCASA